MKTASIHEAAPQILRVESFFSASVREFFMGESVTHRAHAAAANSVSVISRKGSCSLVSPWIANGDIDDECTSPTVTFTYSAVDVSEIFKQYTFTHRNQKPFHISIKSRNLFLNLQPRTVV